MIGTPSEGFAPVELCSNQSSDIVIAVGFSFSPEADFCVIGNGWCGGVFNQPITIPAQLSDSTIGPYIAACLAAGELFRLVRLIGYMPERQLFLNALDYSQGPKPSWSQFQLRADLRSVLLVGVGAVGCAVLHTLYPLSVPGTILIADNDPAGVDQTNLGRSSLFGLAALGKQKASYAAQLLRQAEFRTRPHDGSFEHFFEGQNKPAIVLSAVDTNATRHALQEQYAALFLSASTLNLRAEVLRCGPPSVGACLACFNPLETNERTEEQIRTLLQERPETVDRLSEKLRLNREEVAGWIFERKCSETGERLIEELRTDDGSMPAFAVGFVSVLAGTLLAAELLKALANHAGPLDEVRNRAVFQFQNPTASTNGSHYYPRDERCAACSPENAGGRIWKQRYEQFREANRSVAQRRSRT
jgi:molybdopterin/thiamine biosynthesis adenylyltransferase